MKLNIATIEVKPTDLTVRIVAQLDRFEPASFGRTPEEIKAVCTPVARVTTSAGDFMLIETPKGTQVISKGAWFAMAHYFISMWGKFDDVEKVILLK